MKAIIPLLLSSATVLAHPGAAEPVRHAAEHLYLLTVFAAPLVAWALARLGRR